MLPIIIDTLICILWGFLGMCFYTLFKVRKYINSSKLKLYIYVKRKGLIHSFLVIIFIAIILIFIPDINTDIQDIIGYNIIANNKKSFFMFGITLSYFYD